MTISSISSNPLSSSNLNHTYGLSGSGIDVDSMVKKLMTAATVPYTKMWQKEQRAEWKKAEYNTFYNSINTYNTSTVFNYTLQSTTLPQIGTSSNISVATVTANADAANINHSLTVTQLASSVTQTSSAALSFNSSQSTLAGQLSMTDTSKLNFTINGKSFTIDPTKQTIYDVVNSINNAGANVKANYDTTLNRFFLYSTNTGSNAGISFAGSNDKALNFISNNLNLPAAEVRDTSASISSGPIGAGGNANQTIQTLFGISTAFTLKVNTYNSTTGLAAGTQKSITVNPTDNLSTVLTNIQTATGGSVTYDAVNDKVSLQAAAGTYFDFSGSDQTAKNFLSSKLKLNVAPMTGQDAQFTLDGTSLTESSNNFTISGVTYNLLSSGSTTVSISADVDKIVSNVQSFVDSYNTMLSSLTTEVSQPVYSDYLPLTDDQKSQMKDSDIAAWNAKAKSGLLHNDSILQNVINAMRSNVSDPISGLTGKYNSAASIGITTGDYTENGKLHLDTNKLKVALQADPSIVNKIFGTAGSSSNSSSQGIAVRLNNSLKNTVSQIKTIAGITADTTTDTSSNLAIQINDYKTRLTDMSSKLQDLQTRYYNEFDAMESALQQLNSQSSFISSLTSSGK